MANYIVDPNTNIMIPVPGVDPGIADAPAGQDYATLVSNALTALSAVGHTGTPGDGKQIVSAAININGDLTYNNHNATDLRSTRYVSATAPLGKSSDINELYVVNGDLYYNNAAGSPVQITIGTNVNSGAVASAIIWSFKSITAANHTILASDTFSYYSIGTAGSSKNIFLPPASTYSQGQYLFFKDTSGNALVNNITIIPNGTDTIDNVNSNQVINWNNGSLLIVCDGASNWNIERDTATSIQGNAVSSIAPTVGQILVENAAANGSVWVTITGDASLGSTGALVVAQINGATVPAAGSLTTGNTLQVSGASALTYGPVNLAGGSHYVTGVLPTGNQQSQTILGDVTGTTAASTVVKLQGNAIQAATFGAAQDGYVLTWNNASNQIQLKGISGTPGSFTAGGDLTGTATSQNVVNIHGASVPIAGSLTTGNVLQVTGASTLSYAAVNLAGGSNFVTGVLPKANQATQDPQTMGGAVGGTTAASTINLTGNASVTGVLPIANQANQNMSGDVTGTTAASVVGKIQGNAVKVATLGSVQDGYVLTWINSHSQYEAVPSVGGGGSFTAGGDLAGSSSDQLVTSLTGAAGSIPVASTGNIITWVKGTTAPGLAQSIPTTDVAPANMTIAAQSAEAAAATNRVGANLILASGAGATTNGTGGNVIAALTAPTGSGTEAMFQVKRGSTVISALGPFPGAGTTDTGFWMLPGGASPSTVNYIIDSSSANEIIINDANTSLLILANNNVPALSLNTKGVSNIATLASGYNLGIQGMTVANFGGTVGSIGLPQVTTAPTGAVTGTVLYTDKINSGFNVVNSGNTNPTLIVNSAGTFSTSGNNLYVNTSTATSSNMVGGIAVTRATTIPTTSITYPTIYADTATGNLSFMGPSSTTYGMSVGASNININGLNVQWTSTSGSSSIGFANLTADSGTGANLTISAQNETGATSVGGNLNLKSGTGTSTNGSVVLSGGGYTDTIMQNLQGTQNSQNLNSYKYVGTCRSTSATLVPCLTIPTVTNKQLFAEITWTARNTTTQLGVSSKQFILFKNIAGVVTEATGTGTATAATLFDTGLGAAASMVFSVSGTQILLGFTGTAATTQDITIVANILVN